MCGVSPLLSHNYPANGIGDIPINAISFIGMHKLTLDSYVLDVLMPDLVGHDKRPAAFVVYLFLLAASSRTKRKEVAASLQTIAVKTGLSKSTVQEALRHLKQRGLVDSELRATSTAPIRRTLQPWVR
jgi:DNA-binding transcriptional ArsR family regulator